MVPIGTLVGKLEGLIFSALPRKVRGSLAI